MLTDHLAHQLVEDYQPIKFDFSDEDIMVVNDDEGTKPRERWTIMFDGASNVVGHGIGAVLMSPKNFHMPFTAKLCFDCTNNITEYESCITGIEAAIDLKIKILEVYGDSVLVIHQIKGDWKIRHPNMIPYRDHILELIP